MVNFTKPGVGVVLAAPDTDDRRNKIGHTHPKTLVETIVHVFPASVVEAMVRGDVLQIVAFAVLFAMAVSAVGEKGKPILRAMESLSQVMFKFTNYVMMFAPIGVGAAMAHTVGTQGLGVLTHLGNLILSLYLGLVIFIVFVFGAVMLIARIPFRQFVRAVREPADDRLRHHEQRIGFAESDGSDGALRRAATHRRLSSCRPVIHLISTARRFISRSLRSSSRRRRKERPGITSASANRS